MRKILMGVGIAAALLLLAASWLYLFRDRLPFGPGGHVLLEVELPDSSDPHAYDRAMDMTAAVLRRRMDIASLRRVGARRLLIGFSGRPDLALLVPALTRRSVLTFNLVDDSLGIVDVRTRGVPIGEVLYETAQGPVVASKMSLLNGSHIVDAVMDVDPDTREPAVEVRFDSAGAERLARITTEHVNHPLAVIWDGKLVVAPVIRGPILGGSLQIAGGLTVARATLMAKLLRGGTLPAAVRIVESGPGLPN